MKNIKFSILLVLFFVIFSKSAFAQLEVSETYDVGDKAAQDGDILSFTDKGFVRSDREGDNKIFGVVQNNPLISYRRTDKSGTIITRNGAAEVNVTTINGPIKVGDFITTSTLPGKGTKADNSGYVIGMALKEFKESDGTKQNFTAPGTVISKQISVGKIPVAIKIEYAEINTARNANRLLDAVNAAFFRNVNDPEKFVNIFRYIAAGLAVIIAFIIGFFTFGRSLSKGIEALGRNPLARTTIQFGIITNIIFTILIVLAGVVAAVILLRF